MKISLSIHKSHEYFPHKSDFNRDKYQSSRPSFFLHTKTANPRFHESPCYHTSNHPPFNHSNFNHTSNHPHFTTPAIIHQPKVQPCLPQLPQGKKSCSVCVRPTSRPWSVCPDEIFTVRRCVEHWSSFQYHDVESHPTTHQRHSQR